jgi:signal transduction histidine kinase/streptogramin lyase
MGLVDFVQEQGDSLLWFASRSGLTCYSFRTDQFMEVDLGLSPPFFTAALFPDEEGNLWAGVNGYVVQIRDCRVVNKLQASGLSFLVQDHRGNLWFGSYAGLYRVRKDSLMSSPVDHFTTMNGLMENTLKTALVDRENNLWIGGIARGITRLSETNTYRFELNGINPPYQYSIGTADLNGHIWVATPSGLCEIWEDSIGRWHQALAGVGEGRGERPAYPVFGGLVKGALPYSVFVDHRGRLWIGYSNAQLACFEVTASGDAPSRLKLVRTLRPKVDFPDGFPVCFTVDRSDMVWYSEGNRILLLDPGRRRPLVRIFSDREGIPSKQTYIRAFAGDKHGNIWVGGFNTGVARLDADSISRGSFRPFPLPGRALEQRIASIREDRGGRIWIASESNGVFIHDNGNVETRSIKDGLPSDIVTSVTEDSSGRVWVSTGVGLAYLDSVRSRVVHRRRDLADSYVFCSGSTKNGRLWFVTMDGLVVYKPSYGARHEVLPSPLITSLRANGEDLAVACGLKLPYDRNHIEIGFVAISFRDQKDVRYQYRMSGIDPDWSPTGTTRAVTYAALPPGDYTFEVRAFDARGVPAAKTTSLDFSVVPPFWRTWWFGTLAFIVVLGGAGGTVRYIEITRLRRQLRALEQQQALDLERLRISRDMHDEVGSTLTEIAILSELTKREIGNGVATKLHLQKISDRSREVLDSISQIIWAISPKNDLLGDLAAYLRTYATQYFAHSSIHCRVDFPETFPDSRFAAESRRNIFLMVKEALHNVLKHSGATDVDVRLTVEDQTIVIVIEDNGKGFSLNEGTGKGIGLHSMKKRAQDIGGTIEFESNQPSGTRVCLRIPLGSAEEEKRGTT